MAVRSRRIRPLPLGGLRRGGQWRARAAVADRPPTPRAREVDEQAQALGFAVALNPPHESVRVDGGPVGDARVHSHGEAGTEEDFEQYTDGGRAQALPE